MLCKVLLPLLTLGLLSTASTSAEAAEHWKIKRQVWSDISVSGTYVHNMMFKNTIDYVGGRISTNSGSRLSPVCRTSDGRIGGATPYKSGSTWRMKCLGQTAAQGARALKLKARYTGEPDTVTRARGRLPQATVRVNSGGKQKALCLATVGGQQVPGVMDIPAVTSTAPLPSCKVWLMGKLTPISRWAIVKYAVAIPSQPNTWWSPGSGDQMPQLPTYVVRSGTKPMCRTSQVFGAKWPGVLIRGSGPQGMSVYCNFSYLDGQGNVKAGKTPVFEVYLASNPARVAFPRWGSARAGSSANYPKGLQVSKYKGDDLYLCLQTYGKRGISTRGSGKCRAANGSAAREGHFKLLER